MKLQEQMVIIIKFSGIFDNILPQGGYDNSAQLWTDW
jgi:hypothetical protein